MKYVIAIIVILTTMATSASELEKDLVRDLDKLEVRYEKLKLTILKKYKAKFAKAKKEAMLAEELDEALQHRAMEQKLDRLIAGGTPTAEPLTGSSMATPTTDSATVASIEQPPIPRTNDATAYMVSRNGCKVVKGSTGTILTAKAQERSGLFTTRSYSALMQLQAKVSGRTCQIHLGDKGLIEISLSSSYRTTTVVDPTTGEKQPGLPRTSAQRRASTQSLVRDVQVTLTKDVLLVKVDGKPTYAKRGSYSRFYGIVGIGTKNGESLTIENLRIR